MASGDGDGDGDGGHLAAAGTQPLLECVVLLSPLPPLVLWCGVCQIEFSFSFTCSFWKWKLVVVSVHSA